ncbi:hypothetical protein HYC85_029545 [Camellia sinensis]|uniref:Leucine-rich repeat-containing N-terminal plant-type domain-containing protein n=1 Tax=Camellia sinensis TaxID=4442 RepID=A0A7J7G275_CAMSI|nr:hypothetical protein HYC85_029545 [Camellia sinensis]
MARVLVPIHIVSLMFSLLFLIRNSVEEEVKLVLVLLIREHSPMKLGPLFVLDRFNLTGVLNATSLCKAKSLFVLSLNDNDVGGEIQQEISNCRYLTHLYLSGNRFSSNLSVNISQLSNLKRLNISNNDFSNQILDMSRISGLLSFLAQNNHLSEFNVSHNNLSGPILDVIGHFNVNSFSGNLELCGQPFSNPCPMLTPPPLKKESKRSSKKKFIIYSGFFVASL